MNYTSSNCEIQFCFSLGFCSLRDRIVINNYNVALLYMAITTILLHTYYVKNSVFL